MTPIYEPQPADIAAACAAFRLTKPREPEGYQERHWTAPVISSRIEVTEDNQQESERD